MKPQDADLQKNLDLELSDENIHGLRFGIKPGVFKKSLRPSKSVKPLSLMPKRFLSMPKVQKVIPLQEKKPESI